MLTHGDCVVRRSDPHRGHGRVLGRASAPAVVMVSFGNGEAEPIHEDELVVAAFTFRTGRVSFEWVERANVIVLEHDASEGNGLAIEPPPGLIFDRPHFEDWCREFVGIG